MIRLILAYLLFILGFVTVTYFKKHGGEIIPYPFIFWTAGIIMFIAGIFLLRKAPRLNEENEAEEEKNSK
jgi:hypothetical protein